MSATVAARTLLRVSGTVQGVGFRPFVYRLAGELALGGFVRNDDAGVTVEVEGDPDAVAEFVRRLRSEAPPLARIEAVTVADLPACGERAFVIAGSVRAQAPQAQVSPDTATCPDCLAELFDPANRRHRYPFINCTNCGPRFTIVRGVPYDRALTTMAGFRMCPECRAEYEDPGDRRFHAEPNACPACGPQLSLLDADGVPLSVRERALAQAVDALRDGAIVAVKGLGGFHLACLAGDSRAVAALRARKHREHKPFALMVRDVAAARRLVSLTASDEMLLSGRERPIVLARARPGAPVAPAVAPGLRLLGVMLPYSPLHHLLMHDLGEPLVMTSGNLSEEPIAFEDGDALARLAGIADLFLVHDRPIRTRTDDSVLRSTRGGAALMIRRSRGYAPTALPLPVATPRAILACGAEQKNTFCLARGGRAWVSHHIGDLENYETLAAFRDGVEHFARLYGVRPEVAAHDLHPDYLSTRYALELELDGGELVGVQHHHAHLAAVLAEHGERGPALAAIYDGTGYGIDGTIWGGELLVGDLAGFSRAGHLWPVRLPGGAAAVREPWRMACAWLAALEDPPAPPAALRAGVARERWEAVTRLARGGIASPVTTSVGRLFDAVAALCGGRLVAGYDGQAAAELEDAVEGPGVGPYPFVLGGGRDGAALVLDPRPAIAAIVEDVRRGVPRGVVAARFHAGLGAVTAAALVRLAEATGIGTAVLAGGSFVNRVLLEHVRGALRERGLRVLVPERLPPNDGAIAFGQAAVAAARLGSGREGAAVAAAPLASPREGRA